jgi:Pyridoxamine 5'-phosphate oxidase
VNHQTRFSPDEIAAFEPAEKIGLLATITPEGQPHLSLITTIQAKSSTEMMWGQFTEGLSKQHVKHNPHVAWLILTLDRRLWRGTARYTHASTEGDDYRHFNEKPMFRYNTYFGIHTVHYMDLVGHTGELGLPLGKIVPASVITKLAKGAAAGQPAEPALNPFSIKLFDRLDTLKFLAYIGADGFPHIVPLLQCQAADARTLAFSPLAYGDELDAIPARAPVAVEAMSMQMESVVARGVYEPPRRRRIARLGTVAVDWVYNSMPPKMGQIYPPIPLQAVTDFKFPA